MVLTIEPFNSSKHNRSCFDCGKDSLNTYIRQQASQDLKRKIASIFVLVDTPDTNILAYYTLSAYAVEMCELSETLTKHLPRYPRLPATLLGRLAVDCNYQGKSLGKLVLIDALKRALEATTQVASLLVVAEAIDETAIDFYQKFGFQAFKEYSSKLYLPMKTIEQM